jgi:Domain of unknown function DUF11/FG-GAP-like repeat/Putative binding domain, N-terminal
MKLHVRNVSLFLSLGLCVLSQLALGQKTESVRQRQSDVCRTPDAANALAIHSPGTGVKQLSLCDGHVLGAGSSRLGNAQPLTLASADFDQDGVPDLVSGYKSGNSGTITVHRGNIAALWPYGAALQYGTPSAFFPDARTFSVPEAPDFLLTGDFDADGHWDIVTGHRGSDALYFLRGNGKGGFAAAKRISVAGSITAVISGEVNRADGLTDIIVAAATPSGARALVLESSTGAINAQPEMFNLPHAATALALGRFDGGAMNDLAIGSGNQLIVIHGRDRQLSQDAAHQANVAKAWVTVQQLSFTVTALVTGDFTGGSPSVAALGSDGQVHILEHTLSPELLKSKAATDPNYRPTMQLSKPGSDGKPVIVGGTLTPSVANKLALLRDAAKSNSAEWTERSRIELPSGFSQSVPRLVAARISGSLQDEILAADTGNRQVHVLSAAGTTRPRPSIVRNSAAITPTRSAMKLLTSLDAESAPAAVLPMRLNKHGLSGLVTLHEGQSSPVLTPHDVPPTNVFVVTNTLDIDSYVDKDSPPAGSLRAAMEQAEAASEANGGGAYEIDFDIPTSDPGYNSADGSFLIQPLSQSVPHADNDFALPPINATLTIDGYTQPGASPNTSATSDNAKILIRIDGAKASTPGGAGLSPFDDVGSVYRGMDFTGWINPDISSSNTASGADGIEAGGVQDFIEGNFFGTDPTGMTGMPNRIGIFADAGPGFGSTVGGNIIGGTTPQARNIFSANSVGGILFLSIAYYGELQGNFIGLDATGNEVLNSPGLSGRSNLDDGVGLNGPSITIGGTLPHSGNVIAGNGTNVDINDLTDGNAAKGSTVQGNIIGLNASGAALSADQGYGVSILHNPTNMLIGGTTPAARNIISNNLAGVYVFDNSYYNTIQGNYIGTDPTGASGLGNTNQGFVSGSTINTEPPAASNTIGGAVSGAGNLISGNLGDGILIQGTSTPPGSSTYVGDTIQGNYIGTDATGAVSIGNGGNGISLTAGAANNIIGGGQPGSGNLITHNAANGISIDPASGANNNGGPGTGNVTIANTITSNTGAGVRIVSGSGNRISQNSIYLNGALGIDTDVTGENATTHCNSSNTGANNLQNAPSLTAGSGTVYISATATDPNGNTSEFSNVVQATATGSMLSLLGSFDSTANTAYTIEFFSSPAPDASGFGQGQTFVSSTSITTDSSCTVAINNPVDTSTADVSANLGIAYGNNPIIGPDMGNNIYVGTVTNNGPATAHSVVFTDTLPSQLAISSAYCNVGSCQTPITTTQGACTVSGNTITCNLGAMPSGDSATIDIPFQALTQATVTNTASVTATEPDPNLANNTSSKTSTTVYPFPFLDIDQISPSAVVAGSPDLILAISGIGLLPSTTVTFNGTPVTVTGIADNQECNDNQVGGFCSAMQILVPASLLTTAGTYTIEANNPSPGEGNNSNFPSDINYTVVPSCSYTIYESLDSGNLSADGTSLIADTIYVGPNAPSCSWTVASSVPWLTVLDTNNGGDPPANVMDSGPVVGTGDVDIAVAPNTTSAPRSGSITIAGQTYNFTQDGNAACGYAFSPSSQEFPVSGGSGSIPVTSGCDGYFVQSYAPWITIPESSSLLEFNATANFTVGPNAGPPRVGTIVVGGAVFTVNQDASSCYFTLSTNSALIPEAGGGGSLAVTASSPSCAWTATSSNSAQLSVTSGASGTGNGTVSYTLPANTIGPISPTITVGTSTTNAVFTANQASAYTCSFSLSPGTIHASSEGLSNSIVLKASYSFCKWTAASSDPTALAINGSIAGTGTAGITYRVAQNDTGSPRTLTLTAGCQTFTVTQDAVSTANPLPAITALSPNTEPAASPDFTLTVTGTNFVPGSTISLNGVGIATTYVSATQVTATVSTDIIAVQGTYNVIVTNPAPGGGSSNALPLTITAATSNPVPEIDESFPGSATLGAAAFTETVDGHHFIPSSTVYLNGSPITTTFKSGTVLTATIPASALTTSATLPFTVVNPAPGGGTSNASTIYVGNGSGTPTIISLQPNNVAAGSGAFTLVVVGANYVTGSVVNFNGVAEPTAINGGQLSASIPASAITTQGTVPVTVTNPSGGGTSNSVNFTITAPGANPPTVTSLQPATAVAGSAAFTLTVTGTNFVNGSKVSFNSAAATTTFVSASQLTAAIPASAIATPGSAPVTVTNPSNGGTSAALNFTITSATTTPNPVPTATALQPASVTAGTGAFTLAITGTNFISSSVVNFNGSARTTTYVSATQVSAAVTAADIASAGMAQITVTNPAPGGGTTAGLTLTIVAANAPAVTFDKSSLSFGSLLEATTSAAQTVNLTNSGTAALNITGINITGSNPSDFAQTNTCGTTLDIGDSCAISVTFTPASAASFSATLSVADNAAASPQTVSLTGTGTPPPDFTVTSSAAAQSVSPGGAAQYTITVAATNGTYPGSVTLAASGLPPGATATFSEPVLTPGSGSVTSQLSIQTAAPVKASGLIGIWPMTLCTIPMAGILLVIARRRKRLLGLLVVLLASLGAITAITGCGGGFGSSGTSYTITVTGTSGNDVQTTTVKLTVK